MKDFINPRSQQHIGYFELLSKIDAKLIDPSLNGFRGLLSPGENGSIRRYWIRHDVDDKIDRAWNMAVAEHERGIKSAYFFLNTAPYFRLKIFLDMARDFVKAGHTIGLHNNSVSAAYKGGDPKLAEQILQRDLGYLRRAGPVFMTASHGDIWNRQFNIVNYEMFTECRRGGSFPHNPLSHYKLEYEAYFTPRCFYLSDSGGVWSTTRDINISLNNSLPLDDGGDPMSTINQFNNSENGILQLLVHPEWWEPKT